MIYIRSTLANIGVYGCLLFGCVVSSAMGLFSRKSTIYFWNYFMIPVTMFVLRLTAGIKIEIRGRQHLRQDGVIYASKHESALETYCMSMFIKKRCSFSKRTDLYSDLRLGTAFLRHDSGQPRRRRFGHESDDERGQRPHEQRPPDYHLSGGNALQAGHNQRLQAGTAVHCRAAESAGYSGGAQYRPVLGQNSFLRYPGKVIIEFMEPMPEIADKKEFMAELEKELKANAPSLMPKP